MTIVTHKISSADRSSLWPVLCLVAVALYAWLTLVVQHGDQLYIIQDFTPWMATSDYFSQYLYRPGGPCELLGNWLTQFFFYPCLGATILVSIWSLSAFFLIKANVLQGWWMLLATIPVVSLFVSIIDMGYLVFCLKTPGYWFGPSLALLFVSSTLFIYTRVRPFTRLVVLFLTVLIGYPLFGGYSHLAVLVMLILSGFEGSRIRWFKLLAIIAVPALVVFPLYYHSSHVQWRADALFSGFPHVRTAEVWCPFFDIPFYVMVVSVFFLPLMHYLQRRSRLTIPMLVLVALPLVGSNILNYRNQNYLAELRMMRSLDGGDWNSLLSVMRESSSRQKPTRAMVMMKDVALAQMGSLGDNAFDYEIGGLRPQMNADFKIHSANSVSPLVYYWLGLPNFGYVWSMENGIKYGMSPYFLRTLYRCMLANGEYEAAEKYRKLLSTTLFWRDYRVSDDEVASVRRFMTGDDRLVYDGGLCEKFLLGYLKDQSYDSPVAQQLAVHFSILARDKACFDKALARYVALVGDGVKLPKYFNENSFNIYYGTNTGNKTY